MVVAFSGFSGCWEIGCEEEGEGREKKERGGGGREEGERRRRGDKEGERREEEGTHVCY